MVSTESKKLNWRSPIAVVAAFTLVFSAFSSSASMAFAVDEGKAQLKALPKTSLVDDGNSQLLELKFKLEKGTLFEFMRVTINEGEPNEAVIEFDHEGQPIAPYTLPNPPFELVFGQITMLSDGYYAIEKAAGKFVIALNKEDLGPGTHTAFAEVVLGGGADPLVADAEFVLKPSVPLQPDLVAKYFFAPTTIKKPLSYFTFTIETNEGGVAAKAHKVAVYLSNDNTLGGNDKELGKATNEKLNAGWFDLIPIKIKVPNDTGTGAKYLFVKLDTTNKIEEISEDNNTLSKATNIKAS